MDLKITLVGLNHRTASVDIRERFALSAFCSPDTWAIPKSTALKESLILSTCNRVEILGVAEEDPKYDIMELWAEKRQESVSELERYVYVLNDAEAIKHVFRVASSLDSMVLGEPQILGQMKEAYRKAAEAKATGAILNRLMHTSFYVAKRVRNETAIASSAVSVSYAAVELAKKIFGALHGHKAMLIGAGEMAELAAMHLLQAGIENMLVSNRTYGRARELAQKFRGEAIPFEHLANCFDKVDIVIASTGSPDLIINMSDVRDALLKRKNRPMFFIDIAVPRDIDPQINTLDNIYLYDIDDLKEVVEENLAARREEAKQAEIIIGEETGYFQKWLQSLEVQPTIVDMVKRGEIICNKELEKTLKKLGNIPPGQKEAIIAMAHAITRKLYHYPLTYLKNSSHDKNESVAKADVVRKIFDLDDMENKER